MTTSPDRMSVLIVDDEDGIVGMLTEFLERDFAVEGFTDPVEALERLRQHSFDFIISDQRMPGLKGTDLLKESITVSPESERIMLTAYADIAVVIESINEARVSYVLTKPVTPEQVLLSVRQLAKSYRLRKENDNLLHSLRQHNQHLSEEVLRQTSELRSINQKLLNVQKAREQMTQIAVHDLKNPLSNLKLAIDAMERGMLDFSSKEFLAIARDSVEAMNDLVVDMLSIAALSSEFQSLPKRPTQIADILRASVNAFSPAADHKSIDVQMKLPNRLPMVSVNERRMREVFDNLISNAIKYTPQGGSVTVSALADNGSIVLSVSDTGQGMTSEDMTRAFGEFQRLSARPTGGESSTGLGLFIVKRIVDMHEGAIELRSDGVDRGTTFKVRLPVKQATAG